MGAIFAIYPEFSKSQSVPAVKAGSCSFHNGLTIHGAHANMTSGQKSNDLRLHARWQRI